MNFFENKESKDPMEVSAMEIKRAEDITDDIGAFLDRQFTRYGTDNDVDLNFEEFCFVSRDDDGSIMGVITGRAYYNEVHIGDLIVAREARRSGLGSRLVRTVEDAFSGKGYTVITLTTFGFQAPEFYKKLGYEIEFVREYKDPKLSKYFFRKDLK